MLTLKDPTIQLINQTFAEAVEKCDAYRQEWQSLSGHDADVVLGLYNHWEGRLAAIKTICYFINAQDQTAEEWLADTDKFLKTGKDKYSDLAGIVV